MILIVKQILNRGFFRDKVLIAATADVLLARKRLGRDQLQAPDLKREELRLSEGQELAIFVRRGSVREGQQISADQVAEMSAFNKLWKRSEV